MLSYILGIIAEFERKHGRRPQLICLNVRHMCELMDECPGAFDDEHAIPLGFRIMVLSEEALAHPKAVWMPPRAHRTQQLRTEKGQVIVAWGQQQSNRPER